MRSYDYRDRSITLGDYVQVVHAKDPDSGHVGRVVKIRAGGCIVQFGSLVESHLSLWHPANLKIVKEHTA